jgi:hypothetical protein
LKFNWSCTECGMSSGRRDSVQRHVDNVHNGSSRVIPFTEYLAGRVNGSYPPGPKPSFGTKDKSINKKMQEELENTFVKRVAEKCLPPASDPMYSDSVNMAMAEFLKRCAKDEKC